MPNAEENASNYRLIPLSDFFKNPEKTSYLISPNGKYISYLAPHNDRLNIFVQEIGDQESKRITEATERDINAYFWGNNNTIIYLRDNAGDENFHFYSVNIHTGVNKDLTPFEGVRANLVDELEDFDSEILIEMNKRNPEVFDVYRLNFETGEMNLAAENPGNISGWVTDHNGRIRAAITTDGVNTSLMFRENEKDPWKTVITTNFKESLMPVFFTFDNAYLYATSNIGRDKSAIIKYDIKNARELEVIFEHPDVDVSSLSYSKKRKVLTAVSFYTWKRERVFLDEETKKIFKRLEKNWVTMNYSLRIKMIMRKYL